MLNYQLGIDDRLRNVCARMLAESDGDLETVVQEFLALAHKKLNAEALKTQQRRLGDTEAA